MPDTFDGITAALADRYAIERELGSGAMATVYLVEDLKQTRDELEVQMHLAAADARDEWQQVEKKWEHLRARLEVVGKAAEKSADEVGDALELVAQEIKKGYDYVGISFIVPNFTKAKRMRMAAAS